MDEPVQLGALLCPQRILFLDYAYRRDALLALAENLATAPEIGSKQELAAEILKREELMSTAIGKGVAIPHVRLQSVSGLAVSLGISRRDIVDFQPLDDEPVRIVIMIAAAYRQHADYLRTLSAFSARLKTRGVRDALLAARSAEKVCSLIAGMDG